MKFKYFKSDYLENISKNQYVKYICILMITIGTIYLFWMYFEWRIPDIEGFVCKLESLDDDEFVFFKPQKYLKKDIDFVILDEMGSGIYTNSKNLYSDYLTSELNKIPNYEKCMKLHINKKENQVFKLCFENVKKEKRIIIFSNKMDNKYMISLYKNNIFIIFMTLLILILLILLHAQRARFRCFVKKIEYIIDYPEERKAYICLENKFKHKAVLEKLIHTLEEYENNEWRSHRAYIDRQRLISEILHDSRNNMTVIHGYAVSLCDEIVPQKDVKQYLSIIKEKSKETSDLMSKFYEYSKVQHPDFPIKLECNDICEVVKQYLADKYDEIYINGFLLEVGIPSKKIMCKVDEALLCRGIENILLNSIKYNEKGVTIKFNIIERDSKVKIIIGDDGIGISEDIAKIIFEPFVVGNNSSRNNNTSGLGLAITEKIIAAHNGKITLKTPPDIGYNTQFEIELPLII